MNARFSIIAIAGLLSAAWCAHAQPALVDQLFERHVRVKSAVGPHALHLLYQRNADPQAEPSSCYRRYTVEKKWLGEERLHGAHRCVAFFDDALYVFRQESYSVYRTPDWQAEFVFRHEGRRAESEWESLQWPLSWPPSAACVVGGELWLFGVERPGAVSRMAAARIRTGTQGEGAGVPAELGESLKIAARASAICALPRESDVLVFWQQDTGPEGPNELWQATFDGATWTTAERVPLPYERSDYAAAIHEGQVWVLCKPRGQRVKAEVMLMATTFADGRWSRPTPVPDVLDPRLDWTLDIDAASFGGTLFLFRACKNRVVAHRWVDGKWHGPEVLFALSPWPTYLFWWLVLNVLVSVALLPLLTWTALRARRRPRLVVSAFGSEVPMASWARRVAAQMVDALTMLLLCSGVAQWLGLTGEGQGAEGEHFLLLVALYSATFFAYFVIGEATSGQSLGKWLLHISVVGRDGGRPPLLSVVLRNLLRPWPFLVPAAYLVGSLVLLITPTSQRLGDLLARTFVVDLPAPEEPAQDHA